MKTIDEGTWDSEELAQAKEGNDAWWHKAERAQRGFLQRVMALSEEVKPGGVLTLTLEGGRFTPTLYSDVQSGAQVSTKAESKTRQAPETWWCSLSPGRQALVREIADLAEKVWADERVRLEIAKTEHGLKATLVLRLQRPTGGKASAN